MLFAEINDRLEQEDDPVRRTRLEQFLIEAARGMPALSVNHAAQVALQAFDLLQIEDCENLTQVIQSAWRLPIHPASEWQVLGYQPMTNATAISLDVPREGPEFSRSGREPYYLLRQVIGSNGQPPADSEPLHAGRGMAGVDASRSWERRQATDGAAAQVYGGFHDELRPHTVAMLGNLWKIGAVLGWSEDLGSATSRQRVNPPAVNSLPFGPHLSRRDAWYHLDLNSGLGRDVFAEICLCVSSILAGYSPQVWHNPYFVPHQGPMRMVEIEAAGYIACSRLGAPRRRSCTEWLLAHSDPDVPLSEEFDWELVLSTAAGVEDLMRGDTEPVWAAANVTLREE